MIEIASLSASVATPVTSAPAPVAGVATGVAAGVPTSVVATGASFALTLADLLDPAPSEEAETGTLPDERQAAADDGKNLPDDSSSTTGDPLWFAAAVPLPTPALPAVPPADADKATLSLFRGGRDPVAGPASDTQPQAATPRIERSRAPANPSRSKLDPAPGDPADVAGVTAQAQPAPIETGPTARSPRARNASVPDDAAANQALPAANQVAPQPAAPVPPARGIARQETRASPGSASPTLLRELTSSASLKGRAWPEAVPLWASAPTLALETLTAPESAAPATPTPTVSAPVVADAADTPPIVDAAAQPVLADPSAIPASTPTPSASTVAITLPTVAVAPSVAVSATLAFARQPVIAARDSVAAHAPDTGVQDVSARVRTFSAIAPFRLTPPSTVRNVPLPPLESVTTDAPQAPRTASVTPDASSATQATVQPAAAQPAPSLIQPASRAFAAAIAAAAERPAERAIEDRSDTPSTGAALLVPAAAAIDRAVVQPTADTRHPALDLRQERGLQGVIDRIELLRDDASSRADARDTRIRLVPDALGGIDIALRQEGETVHVHFTAESRATASLIADAQPRLAELAEARGIRLGQTSVGTGGGEGQARPQQQPTAPQPAAPPRATPAISDTVNPDYLIA